MAWYRRGLYLAVSCNKVGIILFYDNWRRKISFFEEQIWWFDRNDTTTSQKTVSRIFFSSLPSERVTPCLQPKHGEGHRVAPLCVDTFVSTCITWVLGTYLQWSQVTISLNIPWFSIYSWPEYLINSYWCIF